MAANRHQLGRNPAVDRGFAGVHGDRAGCRLVGHHGRDADELWAPADRLPAVPAPIHSEFYARRHPLTLFCLGKLQYCLVTGD